MAKSSCYSNLLNNISISKSSGLFVFVLCVWACSLLSSVFLCLVGEGFTLTCLPLYIVYHAFLYQDLGNTLFLFMFQRGNICVGNCAVSSLVPCLLVLLLLVDILTVKGQLAAHTYQQLPVPIISTFLGLWSVQNWRFHIN